jgi:exonuclease III
MADIVGDYISRGYEVIFTGDFNDFDSSVVDANNNLPISRVMDIAKGADSNTDISGQKHQGAGWTLQNVASLMPQQDRYTIWWDSNYDCVYGSNETSMIDHVLVTPGLMDHISGVFFDHSAFTPACDSFYSDHWPLVVDFKF